MNKILVLGASGLLGRVLVDFFKQKNNLVGAVSRKPIGYTEKNITAYVASILDCISLDSIIKEYDVIINCTGQITSPINQCLLLNTDGIANIVDAVAKYNKKLIHISSVSVYGTADYVNEDSNVNPETSYGSMKYFSDYLVEARLTNYTILRVSNLFGRNQKKGVINYVIKSYLSNKKDLYFNNNGDLKRYYLHVEDFALIIHEVMSRDIVGLYNVVGKDQLTIKELVAKLGSILDFKFNVNYTDIPSVENIERIDTGKIDNLINQNYKTDIENFIVDLRI
ncbi:MAG: NAD(P)-dependent oxidoreductase [Candidatus Endonucleobacter sp. (ex Gigantidas childressi)]|nr:NAD(P)-dependent oxidoreductase [Candidatus Endonucleobacter sp. (ex Gigantidas childressi)]